MNNCQVINKWPMVAFFALSAILFNFLVCLYASGLIGDKTWSSVTAVNSRILFGSC